MARPINDPAYWKRRLDAAVKSKQLHHAVYICPEDRWRRIEDKHRQILAANIKPTDSILDCGCGYGRLIDMLPEGWQGEYVGVDISPDLLAIAKRRVEGMGGVVMHCELSKVNDLPRKSFDWAILISIRPMIIRELGQERWDEMERSIREVAARLLYLEYDEVCNGFVE